MQGKELIVLVIVLGLALLGNCQDKGDKGKDKEVITNNYRVSSSYIRKLNHCIFCIPFVD